MSGGLVTRAPTDGSAGVGAGVARTSMRPIVTCTVGVDGRGTSRPRTGCSALVGFFIPETVGIGGTSVSLPLGEDDIGGINVPLSSELCMRGEIEVAMSREPVDGFVGIGA